MKSNSCVSWQNAFMLFMYKTTVELKKKKNIVDNACFVLS